MMTYLGTIAGLSGHPMSGPWILSFEDGRIAHIESGHGVRQLVCAFGAREGSGDLLEKIKGQKIVYSVDDFGCLVAFTPVEHWEDELPGPEGIETKEEVMA